MTNYETASSLLDLFGVTAAQEREYAVVDQEFTDHQGYKIQITPFFAIINGTMVDSSGNRFEEQTGQVVTFNYKQILNALIRCTNLFNPALSDKLQTLNRWAAKHHINPNIFLQYATSDIHTKGDNNAREGQQRKELSMGLSIIGDLSSLCFKKPIYTNTKAYIVKPVPEKSISAESSKNDTTSQTLPNDNFNQSTNNENGKSLEDGDIVK